MQHKGVQTNCLRLHGASSAARRFWDFGHFWAISLHGNEGFGDGLGACGERGLMYRGTYPLRNHVVPWGQKTGNPVTNIPFCYHCLPMNRAQSNAGPDSPFRLAHRGGRSNPGPTTSAPRRDRTSDRADYAWRFARGIDDPSHGARAEATTTSGFGAGHHRGEAFGSGRRKSGGPLEGATPSKEL